MAGLAECVRLNPKLRPMTFFPTPAFADAARAWNRDTGFGESVASLTSVGRGLRMNFRDR